MSKNEQNIVEQPFKGCAAKKPHTRIIASVLRLPKNTKTTLKLLSEEGHGSIYQLSYSVPTICMNII